MTTWGTENARSDALHGIQELSRSKFQHNKMLSEFQYFIQMPTI